MGQLILCRELPASNPLYIEELDINIYTAEELSFYIFNNLELIMGEDFVNEKLFRFISDELGRPVLASKLRRWSKNSSQGELLLVILQDLHYYRSDELSGFQERVAHVANASAQERLRQKADNLFSKHRYYEAVLLYDRLVSLRIGIATLCLTTHIKEISCFVKVFFVFGQDIELAKSHLCYLMPGNYMRLSLVRTNLAANTIGISNGNIKEVTFPCCLIVGTCRLKKVTKVIEFMRNYLHLLPTLTSCP